MRLRTVLLLVSLAILVPAVADAQAGGPKADPANTSPKDAARKLFERGTKALDDGDAATAVAALTEAESIFHAPTTLFHLARAQTALKQLVEAEATYKKVVDEKLPAKTSDAFKKAQTDSAANLKDLATRIPKVLITVEPNDAANVVVTMNGSPLSGLTLGIPGSINPGTYTFEAQADGMTAAKLVVSVSERTTADVKLLLSPVGKPPIESNVKVRASEDEWPPARVASIPIMITGGALLVAGGTLFGLSAMRRSEADARYVECPDCEAEVTSIDDEATLFGNLGIGFVAGGGAALLSGILMVALIGGDTGEVEPGRVGFTITPDDVGVTWSARF